MKKILASWLLATFLIPHLFSGEISLVWQVDRNRFFEEDWIMELLSGIDLNIIDDQKFQKFFDNSIVVVSQQNSPKAYKLYFERLHQLNYKFGVILLSDERYERSNELFRNAQFIFRNYWNKKFVEPKVTFFPLGYAKGFWKNCGKEIFKSSDRRYTWFFAGQVTQKPTREAMVHALKRIPSHHVHETFAWGKNDPNALSSETYRDFLLNSIFVPCPRGWWNIDSFRVYEALECGCIPIVEKGPIDYFKLFLGDHPFLTVSSWEDAPALMAELLAHPEALEKRRQECYTWWLNYKKSLNSTFVQTVDQAFNSSR